MAFGRMIMGAASLAMAGTAMAAPSQPARLPLRLAALGAGPEISYHPHRWLTIPRSVAVARPDSLHEEPNATVPILPLRKVEALIGDIHPFGDGLRLLAGFRQQENRRVLRMAGDPAAIATSRYVPMIAVGVAGEAAPALSVSADMGFLGHAFAHSGGVQLITPIEQTASKGSGMARPFAQLSANYRF